MPKIDIATLEREGTGNPPKFNAHCAERIRQCLGDAGASWISASISCACRQAIGQPAPLAQPRRRSTVVAVPSLRHIPAFRHETEF